MKGYRCLKSKLKCSHYIFFASSVDILPFLVAKKYTVSKTARASLLLNEEQMFYSNLRQTIMGSSLIPSALPPLFSPTSPLFPFRISSALLLLNRPVFLTLDSPGNRSTRFDFCCFLRRITYV